MTTSFRTEEDNQSGAVAFANVDNIKLTVNSIGCFWMAIGR